MPNAASEIVRPSLVEGDTGKTQFTEISSDQSDEPIGSSDNISFVLYMSFVSPSVGAGEVGTIVCPETPALRAERGDSPMLCQALPALIVIFKKS